MAISEANRQPDGDVETVSGRRSKRGRRRGGRLAEFFEREG